MKTAKKSKGLLLKEQLASEYNEEMMFLGNSIDEETYDDAIIGVVQMPCRQTVACYDYDKCLECLMRQGMERDDAIEWMEFNVVGAFVGENGPVFLHKPLDF